MFGARTFYYLPYYNAEIQLQQTDSEIVYSSQRTDKPPATLQTTWTIGPPIPQTQPDSLEFFLTERYCLFSEHKDKLYRSRIHHHPWSLQTATVSAHTSTMIQALDISEPTGTPLLHYAEELAVDIWPLEKIRQS